MKQNGAAGRQRRHWLPKAPLAAKGSTQIHKLSADKIHALPLTLRDRRIECNRKLVAQSYRIGLGDNCPELVGLRVCARKNMMRTAGGKTKTPLCAEAPPRRDRGEVDVHVQKPRALAKLQALPLAVFCGREPDISPSQQADHPSRTP